MATEATMGTDVNTEGRNFTFVWRIEDVIGVTRHFKGEYISSPNFMTKTSFVAQWCLIFERSVISDDTVHVSLQGVIPYNPWKVSVDYEVSIWTHEEKPSHTKKGNKLRFIGTNRHTLVGPVKIPEIFDLESCQRDIKIQCDITVHPADGFMKECAFALSADMTNLLHSERFSDFELIAGNRKFHVHKIALLLRARKLLEQLGISTDEKTFPETVEIADMDGDFLQELIYYFYSGKVRTRNPEILRELDSVFKMFSLEYRGLEIMLHAPVSKYTACSKLHSEVSRFQWPIRNFSSTKESELPQLRSYRINGKFIITFDKSKDDVRFSVRRIPARNGIFADDSGPSLASVRIEAVLEDGRLLPVVEEQVCEWSGEVNWLTVTSGFVDAVKRKNASGFLKDDVLLLNVCFILRDGNLTNEIEYSELASDWMTFYGEVIDHTYYLTDRCEAFPDIELRVAGQSFKAHRAILSARSSKLSEMIQRDITKNGDGVLHFEDIKVETFRCFLHYIYTSYMWCYRFEDFQAMYVCADRFDVPSLKQECVNFMTEFPSKETIIEALTLAYDHADDRLKTASVKFVCSHADEILRSQQWKDFVRKREDVASEILLCLPEAVRGILRADPKQLIE